MEKIGRRELCAADFRFDPENRVQIGTGSILGQIDPVVHPAALAAVLFKKRHGAP